MIFVHESPSGESPVREKQNQNLNDFIATGIPSNQADPEDKLNQTVKVNQYYRWHIHRYKNTAI